jgi:gliding motility-associated-like protein
MILALEQSRSSLLDSEGCLTVANLDIGLVRVNGDQVICSDRPCPQVVIKNYGLDDVTTFSVTYQINGGPTMNFNWNGTLVPNEIDTIQLPCLTLPYGVHVMTMEIDLPNGQVDEYLPNNAHSLALTLYEPPTLSLVSVSPTHCMSDGEVELNTIGGQSPYLYKLHTNGGEQTSPIFRLLTTGNYSVTVTDDHLCRDTLDIFIPDSCRITADKEFKVNGDGVHLGNNCYRLTEARLYQNASIWYEELIDLRNDMDVGFSMNLGCADNGADGIAFVLQPINTSLGSAGGGIGYEGISPSIAVEFDTWQNGNISDPPGDHVAVIRNGNLNHNGPNNLAGPQPIFSNGSNAEDCNFHDVLIRWHANSQNLKVFVDCDLRIELTYDMISETFNGDPMVFFGFTSATGGAYNVQQVCLKYITAIDSLENHVICKGESIQVALPHDFKNYQWTPEVGITNKNTPFPIFSPDSTTRYAVEFQDECDFIYRDTFLLEVIDPELNLITSLNDSCNAISGNIEATITGVTGQNAEYSIDGINFQKNGFFTRLPLGVYTIYVKLGACIFSEIIRLEKVKEPLADSLLFQTAVTCNGLGSVSLSGVGGTRPYRYRINMGPWQSSGFFPDLIAGNYRIEIEDALGCSIYRDIQIGDFSKKLEIVVDSADLSLDCCDTLAFLSVTALGTTPQYFYSLDGGSWQDEGFFSGLSEGIHHIQAFDEFGCLSDTVEIEVLRYTSKYDSMSVILCEGDSLRIGSSVYKKSGLYRDTFSLAGCCDSIVATNLTVHPISSEVLEYEICSGEFVNVGPFSHNTTGIFNDTFQSIYGCDSIIIVDLLVHPIFDNDYYYEICAGDFIKVGNSQYNVSGQYVDSLQTIQGCDSVINTELFVFTVSSERQQFEICEGENIQVGKNIYGSSGSFVDTFIYESGCDSLIISTDLKVHERPLVEQKIAICEGDSFVVGANIYTDWGIYEDIFISKFGCDSTVITNLYFSSPRYCDSLNCSIYIPNAFSPNEDQINDIFKSFTKIVELYRLTIFDRWGELIYIEESSDPAWDGKTVDGEDALPGVYVYHFEGRCNYGRPFSASGDVTLLE